jgi:ribosomal protein S18 acetylase RimI-like enzyme
MTIKIEELKASDYEKVHSLWESVEGVGLHADCDSKEGITNYLHRNPGMSFVAKKKEAIVGAVLCGHDGRRGYLHHLAVAEDHKGKGIGKALVEKVTGKLQQRGIRRCHIFVFGDNIDGKDFWNQIGWAERHDIAIMSRDIVL